MDKKDYGKSSAYDVIMIQPGVFRIHEFGAGNIYLVIGTEKALLIDTGTGLGDLRKVVGSLTDLPVTVVATHAHPDHIGGMGNYPEIYIHRDDSKHMKFWSARPLRRFYYDTVKDLIKYNVTKKDIRPLKYDTKVIPIKEGHVFDLGGKKIRVIHTPGHTRGSIVLLDEADGIMFTGDDVNPTLLHIVPGSTTIEDWLPGAKRILALADEYKAYNGHDDGISTKKQIGELVALGEELINTRPSKKKGGLVRYYPSKQSRPRITYKPWAVTNKKADGPNQADDPIIVDDPKNDKK